MRWIESEALARLADSMPTHMLSVEGRPRPRDVTEWNLDLLALDEDDDGPPLRADAFHDGLAPEWNNVDAVAAAEGRDELCMTLRQRCAGREVSDFLSQHVRLLTPETRGVLHLAREIVDETTHRLHRIVNVTIRLLAQSPALLLRVP